MNNADKLRFVYADIVLGLQVGDRETVSKCSRQDESGEEIYCILQNNILLFPTNREATILNTLVLCEEYIKKSSGAKKRSSIWVNMK